MSRVVGIQRVVRLRVIVVAALAVGLWGPASHARTWYIRADGTGDAPTIQAAVDSATWGDVVLVGPGTHYLQGQHAIDIPPGVVVTSERGPSETIVQPTMVPTYGLFFLRNESEVSGLWMKPVLVDNVDVVGAGARILNNIIELDEISECGVYVTERTTITNNLIFGGSVGIRFGDCPQGTIVENNIILNGVDCQSCGFFYGGYCNVLRGASVGWCVVGYDVDPQFCGMSGSENYFLQADSPCAPGHIEYCGLIGPLPVGCGTVATEESTWGAIKSLYQDNGR